MNAAELAKKEKRKRYRETAKAKKLAKTQGSTSKHNNQPTVELSDLDSDSSSSIDDGSPVVKKRRNDLSDDTSKPSVTITAYIHVLRPSLPTATSKGRKKANPGEDFMQQGPFKFCSDSSYNDFLDAIATALPCETAEQVPASKITWKPQKPLKALPLPLGGETGYKIMVEQIGMKRADARVITLTMPAPAKPLDEKPVRIIYVCCVLLTISQFWETDDARTTGSNKAFDYDELSLPPSTEEHINQQRVRAEPVYSTATHHLYR